MLTNTKPVLYQPEFFAVAETLIASLVLIMVQETRDMLIPTGSDGRTEESGKEQGRATQAAKAQEVSN